ncbi:MAG: NAD(P)/FAD-dependent oxidoreductase [Acidobacteriota bacterium]|nr:NAD(P)/FAD-dependent oxidoreductase [Acidobacteriota bacterium]
MTSNHFQSAINFDVIIIGGGAAGLSAALWCDELGLKALLLEEKGELGGQLLWTHNAIKNHLGIEANNGHELCDIFLKQIERRNFTIKLSCEIDEIDLDEKTVLLKSGDRFFAKAVIIATGVSRRKLNIAGEEKFKNKGIIESGKRDQDLVKEKNVAVIGGGDAAFENALILAETASEVILIHRNHYFRARAEFVEQAKRHPKIKILTNSIAQKIIGNERVEAVELKHAQTNKTQILPAEAILIRVGVEPNTKLLRGKLDLDENGYVKINQNCETNIKRIFAVGDAANPLAPTVSSAVGMGATAAKVIFALLKS